MNSNLPLLERIARQIGPLLGEVVFVGGATLELFFTSAVPTRVRMTRDADVICEVTGRVGYHRLGERLRSLGFVEDMSPGAPLCRWVSPAGILDVMPTDEAILGFGNPWYEHGIRTAQKIELAAGLSILRVTPPVFLATKLAAYERRGESDLRGSHDIEDIVNVVAYRPEIVAEVAAEDPELQRWIDQRIRQHLIDDPEAEDAVAGNLPDARAPRLDRREALALALGCASWPTTRTARHATTSGHWPSGSRRRWQCRAKSHPWGIFGAPVHHLIQERRDAKRFSPRTAASLFRPAESRMAAAVRTSCGKANA